MLAWMCLGGLAAAASQQEAMDYIEIWRGLGDASTRLQVQYALGVLSEAEDSAAALQQAQLEAEGLLTLCEQTPRWSEDRGLSAAVTAQAAYTQQFFDKTVPTMVDLMGRAAPRDADQVQLEALVTLSEEGHVAHWERVSQALRAFGADHRITILEGRVFPEPPDLSVELPGTPSALSTTIRIGFAIGHYNEALARYEEGVALWDQGLEVTGPEERVALRPELSMALERAQSVPPWMGDETLSFGLEQAGEDLNALWETLDALVVLRQRSILFRRHRAQESAMIKTIQDGVYTMNGAFERRCKRFEKRWHFQDYLDHYATLSQWAQGMEAQ